MYSSTPNFIFAITVIAIIDIVIVSVIIFGQRLRWWRRERNDDDELVDLSPLRQAEVEEINEGLSLIIIHIMILGSIVAIGDYLNIKWWDEFFFGDEVNKRGCRSFWITNTIIFLGAAAFKKQAKLKNNYKLMFKIFLVVIVLTFVSSLISACIQVYTNDKEEEKFYDKPVVEGYPRIDTLHTGENKIILSSDYHWDIKTLSGSKPHLTILPGTGVKATVTEKTVIKIEAICLKPFHSKECRIKDKTGVVIE